MEMQATDTMRRITVDRSPLPRTSEAIAASELRAAIVRGDLAPGSKIRQQATALELGVSLIPVREALKTLAGEGAVTYHPQRGYFVTELPNDAIAQIYAVRSLLESATECDAMPRIGESETTAMRVHLRTQERAAEDHDAVEMIAANRGFHFIIFERCENPWLIRFVTQLWDAVDPYRVLSYRRMWLEADQRVVPSEILTEHERIVTALERHNPDRALRLLEKHRERSRAFLSALLDSAERPE
jgi:DNA-binding GntR family transcriptional regulator